MKNRILLTVFCLLICAPFAAGQYSITGRVVDNESGLPLVGATAQIANSFDARVTGSDGLFRFSGIAAGPHRVTFRFLGYESTDKSIELTEDLSLEIRLTPRAFVADEIVVSATRADMRKPASTTQISAEELADQNMGQDLPILLNLTPSTVTTSDAGAGIGYTGIRIRGSDATRINVTINGVPYNDSESQGTFWVNLPDIASSVEDIQIQRGVGTSTNGAGAFGASINLRTTGLNDRAYAGLDNAVGSFGTQKHTLRAGSGLIKNQFAFDGRLSLVRSDGYIDRASSDLKSYSVSAGYFGKRTTLQLVHFSGKERTYQSWYGTPESRINNDEAGMRLHAANNGLSETQTENLLNSGRTYNFYEYKNEVDDYTQKHAQLHLTHQINPSIYASAALHYTNGSGFFEQFKPDASLSDYLLASPLAGPLPVKSDLVRRRWLDNDFFGATWSAFYTAPTAEVTFGGAWNRYDGLHFGEVISIPGFPNSALPHRYYESDGDKTDFNVFGKTRIRTSLGLDLFGDIQLRTVTYQTFGTDNDLRSIDVDSRYTFVNPKAGISWQPTQKSSLYASYSVANREPVRDDFTDAVDGRTPKPESLHDIEAGYQFRAGRVQLEAGFYRMNYRDQLVLTGELNDVGAPLRTNVDKSHRMGVELQAGWIPSSTLRFDTNLTLSRNRIDSFSEVLYDYTNGFETLTNVYEDTEIAFSPSVIAGGQLTWNPGAGVELFLQTKHVGKQYLDNTSNDTRVLDAYSVSDIRISRDFSIRGLRKARISVLVNNVLDTRYSSNGYTYSYIYGDLITENFYYPQAGRHVMVGGSISI